MGGGKPRGMRAGRKLRVHRRVQRWHDKDFKHANFGAAYKANPLGVFKRCWLYLLCVK